MDEYNIINGTIPLRTLKVGATILLDEAQLVDRFELKEEVQED